MGKRAITTTSMLVALIVGVVIIVSLFLFIFPNVYTSGQNVKETRSNVSAVMSTFECQQECMRLTVSSDKKDLCKEIFSGDGPCVGVYGCIPCCEVYCNSCWCEEFHLLNCDNIMECTSLISPHLYDADFKINCCACQPEPDADCREWYSWID